MIEFREATKEDILSITDLIIRLSEDFILADYSPHGSQIYLKSHSLEAMTERILSAEFSYQVAHDRDLIVGVIGVRNQSHLFHLHVAKQNHRQGIAKELWQRALVRLPSSQKTITVNASRYAVPIYQKLGFDVVEGEKVHNEVIFVPMIFIRN